MAIRGRPPKPTLEKEMTGNPGGRPLNALEPKPKGEAVPPKTLSALARVVWDRAVRKQAAGLYTICDEVLLESFCEAEATRLQLQSTMLESPLMVKGSTGQLVLNPLLKAINDQVRLIAQLSSELGFSPRSRQALQIEKPAERANKFSGTMGGQLPPLRVVK